MITTDDVLARRENLRRLVDLIRRVRARPRKALLKYTDDQPRVPAGSSDGGQWTSGDGGTTTQSQAELQTHLIDYKPDRSLTGPDSAAITELIPGGRRMEYLDVPGIDEMHRQMGIEPTLTTDPEVYAKARDTLFRQQPIRRVPFARLIYTQERVNVVRAREIAGRPAQLDLPVYVIQTDDADYVMNGHHRVAAAFLAERGDIAAHVLDLRAALKPFKGHAPIRRALPWLAALDEWKGYPEFNPGQDRDAHGQWTGGSSMGSATGAPEDPGAWDPAQRQAWVHAMAEEAQFPAERVRLLDQSRSQSIGGANPSPVWAEADYVSGTIAFRPEAWTSGLKAPELRGIFAHELLHLRFHAVSAELNAEKARLMAHERSAGPSPAGDAEAHTLPNGDLKPEHAHRYPLIASIDRPELTNWMEIAGEAQHISPYAKMWTTAWLTGKAHTFAMATEVLSEIANARTKGKAHYMAVTTKRLRDLYRAWNDGYEHVVAYRA